MSEAPEQQKAGSSAAWMVALGIFVSRIIGFVREKAITYFFGISAFTDVFQAAFRAPNLLQNLLGEGTISAAFIPIYSRMLEDGRERDAGRFAGAIFGLLLAVASLVVVLGVLFAEPIVTVLVPGFVDDAEKVARGELPINRFALSVQAVRLVFPMTGVLVLSAWALGVLNSHRRFLLPYLSPVVWNVAIIVGLFIAAFAVLDDPFDFERLAELPTTALERLLFAAFIGALVGGILQFAVQLPLIVRLIRGFRFSLSTNVPGVRHALRSFGPVVAGRGAYQLSGYLDTFLASWLAAGALAALRPALMLYMLPVSLFGLSVAASELPELSRIRDEELRPFLARIQRSMRQTLFMTVPSAIGFILFGFLLVGLIFRGGAFGLNDTWLVYIVLAGYSFGLIATTVSRLLQNAFYALHDTRTPAKIALVRVALSAVVATPLMFWLNRFSVSGTIGFVHTGQVLYLGAVGLAIGTTVGAWLELWQLRGALRKQIDDFTLPWRSIGAMVLRSLAAAVPAGLLWWLLAGASFYLVAVTVPLLYGLAYLALAYLGRAPEMEAWTGRLLKKKE